MMLTTIALIVLMVAGSDGKVSYEVGLQRICPPRASLDKWEAQYNESMFANQVRATAWCVQLPLSFPQRGA